MEGLGNYSGLKRGHVDDGIDSPDIDEAATSQEHAAKRLRQENSSDGSNPEPMSSLRRGTVFNFLASQGKDPKRFPKAILDAEDIVCADFWLSGYPQPEVSKWAFDLHVELYMYCYAGGLAEKFPYYAEVNKINREASKTFKTYMERIGDEEGSSFARTRNDHKRRSDHKQPMFTRRIDSYKDHPIFKTGDVENTTVKGCKDPFMIPIEESKMGKYANLWIVARAAEILRKKYNSVSIRLKTGFQKKSNRTWQIVLFLADDVSLPDTNERQFLQDGTEVRCAALEQAKAVWKLLFSFQKRLHHRGSKTLLPLDQYISERINKPDKVQRSTGSETEIDQALNNEANLAHSQDPSEPTAEAHQTTSQLQEPQQITSHAADVAIKIEEPNMTIQGHEVAPYVLHGTNNAQNPGKKIDMVTMNAHNGVQTSDDVGVVSTAALGEPCGNSSIVNPHRSETTDGKVNNMGEIRDSIGAEAAVRCNPQMTATHGDEKHDEPITDDDVDRGISQSPATATSSIWATSNTSPTDDNPEIIEYGRDEDSRSSKTHTTGKAVQQDFGDFGRVNHAPEALEQDDDRKPLNQHQAQELPSPSLTQLQMEMTITQKGATRITTAAPAHSVQQRGAEKSHHDALNVLDSNNVANDVEENGSPQNVVKKDRFIELEVDHIIGTAARRYRYAKIDQSDVFKAIWSFAVDNAQELKHTPQQLFLQAVEEWKRASAPFTLPGDATVPLDLVTELCNT